MWMALRSTILLTATPSELVYYLKCVTPANIADVFPQVRSLDLHGLFLRPRGKLFRQLHKLTIRIEDYRHVPNFPAVVAMLRECEALRELNAECFEKGIGTCCIVGALFSY